LSQLHVVLLLALASTAATDPVKSAKDVIASHERFAAAADLDGVMSNIADDVVALASGSPLVQGKSAFREFYRGVLAMGRWELGHEYDGAAVVGDTVLMHGVARGTITPTGSQPTKFANNFLLILKKQSDGKLRMWRIAFAPNSQ
jgi:ketosteroid isomerase-like protein